MQNGRGEHKKGEELQTKERGELEHKLRAVGLSLFFIWIGVAFLAKIGVGMGLLGVGIITLGMQVVRKYVNLNLEGFWVVIGLLFAVGGIWHLFETKLPLAPIVLIVAGMVLLFSVFRGKQRQRE